uniref:Uncharacterized protein n=1 Tax=Arundo donax TaxID=35708 RepID=A0A0A8YEN2_ARUDO
MTVVYADIDICSFMLPCHMATACFIFMIPCRCLLSVALS